MSMRLLPHLVAFGAGLSYWALFCRITGVNEPWDASGAAFWGLGYPVSLVLSGLIAFRFGGGGWAGLWITLAQLVVMSVRSTPDPLILVGLVFIAFLSIPAVVVAWLAGRARSRR